MINISHVPLQLDRLLTHQLERGISRGFQSTGDPGDGIDRLVLRKKAQFEVGCDGLLSAPVVQERVVYLPINIVFYASKVCDMLHLFLLKHLLLLLVSLDHRALR